MMVKVGCCGFPVSKEEYYKTFDVVEIQQTFYQPPQEKTIQKWREEAPLDFQFTLKSWQLITHPSSSPTYRRLKQDIPKSKKKNYGFFKPTEEVFLAWERTEKTAQILNAKIIVFQCPASFQPVSENKKNLEKFFKTVERKEYLFVWEPRGKWEREEISSLCGKLNLISCVDPFKLGILPFDRLRVVTVRLRSLSLSKVEGSKAEPPKAGRKPFPGRMAYFRLHGKKGYRYKYTDSDLKELEAQAKGFDSVYFMFNNVYMFEDALRFKEKIVE